ncbi:MAG: efflux RND transporter periplasmic adaptor subunit [Desulfovibrio sp.]|uniref:efflux RND transporter periplasmic adaptor subunit n=1 Tax=uncultured Desulfovibrio sp. TaxID=167968 RepID=UPI001B2DCC8F|nr:efflux RND transporter periplasmic adaptor subunit [uncultured Desulfovibrio sp.]MBO5490869.1 efflux RND transporter periplasmic adaptor subunit [Desulfovibrio sp.]MBO6170708.1 efflux RND transporter periplasmic adaptor subunit [Desulfovibrio sp.]
MTIRQFVTPLMALGLCFGLAACESEKKTAEGMALPVSVVEVKAEDTPWPAAFQAQASGSRSVEVRARVQGIIEKRLYNEGDFVKEGQVLFEIERDTYEAQVQQAQAQFNNAEREWRRVRPLYEKNAVSQKERDAARAAYDSSRAALRTARINLDYCQVVSPVSGYSSKENFTVGNLVSNNSLLTYVNQTDPMHIDFSIAAPERMRRQQLAAAGRLRQPEGGRYKARLRLLDGSMYQGEGEVTFIDSQVQPTTGVIKARAVFDNSDGQIMPGQYVRLFVDGDVLVNAVLIPQKCVMLTQQGAMVMGVDKDNKVYPIPVKVSETVGDKYLVDSGLKGGERIVLEGLVKARPGAPVSIQPSMDEQAKARAAKAAQDADKKSGSDNK